MSSPNGEGENVLNDIEAVAQDDIWAVGFHGGPGSYRTLAEHWNGASWQIVVTPDIANTSSLFTRLAVVSADDIWAAGQRDLPGGASSVLLSHWDGASWTTDPITTTGQLLNIAAVSSDDIWAVGISGPYGSYRTVSLHWDGASWTEVATPNLSDLNNYLYALAVLGDQVYALGYTENASTLERHSFVLKWDGSAWQQQEGSAFGQIFDAVAVGTDEIWASGDVSVPPSGGDPSTTFAWHYVNGAWQVEDTPNSSSYQNFFWSLTAISPTEIWTAGHYNPPGDGLTQTLLARWDGSAWQMSPHTVPGVFQGITSTPQGDLWTAGFYFSAGIKQTQIWHAAPCAANPTPTATPVPFTDVASSDYYYEPVQYLAAHGALSGYDSNPPCAAGENLCFKPFNNTTRGQVVKIAIVAEGIPLVKPTAATFSDVPVGSVFYPYIETAVAGDIVTGYANGTFKPNNYVTRGQLAKIIALAAGWALVNPDLATFRDLARGSTFYKYVETAVEKGVISGYDCGTGCREFRPGASAIRAQIAKIVYLTVSPPTP